jgi:hypothetical protein
MTILPCRLESDNPQSAETTLLAAAVAHLPEWKRDCTSHDEWQQPFLLAQRIQGLAGALDAGPALFAPVVLRFYEDTAYGAAAGLTFDDLYFQFEDAWERVIVPGGAGALLGAFRQAQAGPIPLAGPLSAYGHPALQTLASVVYYMAQIFPAGFVLPQVQLEELFREAGTPVHQTTISAMIRTMERHHLIRVVDATVVFDPTRQKPGRAKRYALDREEGNWFGHRMRARLRVVDGGRA